MRLVRHEIRYFVRYQLHTKELVDQRQPQRQEVCLALIPSQHLMLIAVELHKTIHKLPYFRDMGMEDMRAIFVYLNACLFVNFAADIAVDSAVHKSLLPTPLSFHYCHTAL